MKLKIEKAGEKYNFSIETSAGQKALLPDADPFDIVLMLEHLGCPCIGSVLMELKEKGIFEREFLVNEAPKTKKGNLTLV